MELNNCFNSATCTSITQHFGGIGSPADGFGVPDASVIAGVRQLYGNVTRCGTQEAMDRFTANLPDGGHLPGPRTEFSILSRCKRTSKSPQFAKLLAWTSLGQACASLLTSREELVATMPKYSISGIQNFSCVDTRSEI